MKCKQIIIINFIFQHLPIVENLTKFVEANGEWEDDEMDEDLNEDLSDEEILAEYGLLEHFDEGEYEEEEIDEDEL